MVELLELSIVRNVIYTGLQEQFIVAFVDAVLSD